MTQMTRRALLTILAPLLVGCGTTEPGPVPPLEAVVEGIVWSATEYDAVRRSNGRIVITGSSPIDIELTLELVADTLGTYPVGTGLSSAMVVDEGVTYVAEGTRAGSVTVTAVRSERIEGYFGFTARRFPAGGVLRDVTNGKFSLPLSSD